jgi:hypothetical protein
MTGAIMAALKAVEVGEDHTPLASEVPALTGTAADVRRRTTAKTDFKAAKIAHKEFLDKIAAERQGHTPLPAPLAARVTVGELLDQLEADFRLRGVKWWAQAKYHAAVVRTWFGDQRAGNLTRPASIATSKRASKTTTRPPQ